VKVSGDIEVIGAVRNLDLLQKAGAGAPAAQIGYTSHADDFLATITRVTISADLTDNVSTVVRLLNERYWGNETENTGAVNGNNNDITLDLAYVTLKEFLYSPLTMTIGRQELHFGNDMIIGDPDTNNRVTPNSPFGGTFAALQTNRPNADLSARKSFDAIRSTLNYDPVVIDMVYAKVREGALNQSDDINLLGVNAGWDVSKKLKVEGYFWTKQLKRKSNTNTFNPTGIVGLTQPENKERYTNVIGAKISGEPIDALTYSVEGAFQFGRYNGNDYSSYYLDPGLAALSGTGAVPINPDANLPGLGSGAPLVAPTVFGSPTVTLRAWAIEAFLNYEFKKVKYTPAVGACYAYFSGDDTPLGYVTDPGGTHTQRRTGWDPMFENQKFGDIHNALFNQTNQHIVGLNGSLKPFQDVKVKGEAYAYFLAKAGYDTFNAIYVDGTAATPALTSVARPGQLVNTTKNAFLGTEYDLTLTYDYTEDVQFNVLGALFLPGNVFSSGGNPTGVAFNISKADNACSEVIGSMKVTF
jgi:hypothetical protein